MNGQPELSVRDSILKGILQGFPGWVVYYVLGIKPIDFRDCNVFNEFGVLGFSALVALFRNWRKGKISSCVSWPSCEL